MLSSINFCRYIVAFSLAFNEALKSVFLMSFPIAASSENPPVFIGTAFSESIASKIKKINPFAGTSRVNWCFAKLGWFDLMKQDVARVAETWGGLGGEGKEVTQVILG